VSPPNFFARKARLPHVVHQCHPSYVVRDLKSQKAMPASLKFCSCVLVSSLLPCPCVSSSSACVFSKPYTHSLSRCALRACAAVLCADLDTTSSPARVSPGGNFREGMLLLGTQHLSRFASSEPLRENQALSCNLSMP
jgi:hypothetical protein